MLFRKCCSDVLNCFGCTSGEVRDSVTIEFAEAGWSWSAPTSNTCTESGLILCRGSFGNDNCNTEHGFLSALPDNVNGINSLTKHADNENCKWYWWDLTAVQSKLHTGSGTSTYCNGGVTVIQQYALSPSPPESGISAPITYTKITDPDCGTSSSCSTPIKCYNGNFGWTMTLTIQTLLEGASGVFTTNTGGSPHWVLTVSGLVGRYGRTVRTSPNTTPFPDCDLTVPSDVRDLQYAVGTAVNVVHDVSDTGSGAGTCPPYRYVDGDFFPLGGGFAQYVKEIDCVNDFTGSDVTLPLCDSINGVALEDKRTDWDVVAPFEATLRWPT